MPDVSRFLSQINNYNANSPIQEKLGFELITCLKTHYKDNKFANILEFGCANGRLFRRLKIEFDKAKITGCDINDFSKSYFEDEFFIHDMNELNPIKKRFDLIISNACFQWLNPRLAISSIKSFSHSKSIIAFTTFDKHNFAELGFLCEGLNYLSKEELYDLLSLQFCDILIKPCVYEMCFDSPFSLLRHLRLSGVNTLKQKRYLGKEAIKIIQKQGCKLTYSALIILARIKNHPK